MKVEMSKTEAYYHIRIPVLESYHSKYLRKFLDWLRLREISSKSAATEKDIEGLSEYIMQQWWNENKNGFLK
ncbi:MAG: hypothetical protein R2941_12780 [Desulfobacterales bacterium]